MTPAAAVPHRYFRVLLLEPNADALNPHHVSLSALELYGNFFRSGGGGATVP